MDEKCDCNHQKSDHHDEIGACYKCSCCEFRVAVVPLNLVEKTTDPVVEAVRADVARRHSDYGSAVATDLLGRSRVGIAKYGVTLYDSGLTLEQFLQHAYEECLDEANYLRGAMMRLRGELP